MLLSGSRQLFSVRSKPLCMPCRYLTDWVTLKRVASARAGQLWTQSELDRLRDLRTEGRRDEDIASELGRSFGAVTIAPRTASARMQRLWTEEETAQMKALRAQGSTARSIAESLGRSLYSVEHKLLRERRGEEFRTRFRAHPTETVNSRTPWSQEELTKLTDMCESGLKRAEMARSMGRSQNSIKRRLQQVRQGHMGCDRLYTPQEVEKLAQSKAEGLSWTAIHANMPDRSIQSLKARLYSSKQAQCSNSRRGLAWTEEEVDQAHELKAAGVKLLDIASALGRTFAGVRHVLTHRRQDLIARESPTS